MEKKFLKKISDAGKRFGNKVGTTLNKWRVNAVSDRQINKKKIVAFSIFLWYY